MTNLSENWHLYRNWTAAHYPVWGAYLGLVAAFTLAFILVLE